MSELPAGYAKDNGYGQPTHRRLKSGDWVRTPEGYCLRPEGWYSHIRWKGAWVEVPSLEELQEQDRDGICETPDGDSVEPDHPHSWLVILGIM
jgi:hypothetical protein